jgi:hypothetical protein
MLKNPRSVGAGSSTNKAQSDRSQIKTRPPHRQIIAPSTLPQIVQKSHDYKNRSGMIWIFVIGDRRFSTEFMRGGIYCGTAHKWIIQAYAL